MQARYLNAASTTLASRSRPLPPSGAAAAQQEDCNCGILSPLQGEG